MKRTVAYYEDKYGHGFLHYLRRCSLLRDFRDDTEEAIDSFIEFIRPLGRFLFVCIVMIGRLLVWLPLRVVEYRTCRKKLPGLLARAALDGKEHAE